MKLTADNEAINYLKDYFNKDFIEITVDGEKKIFVSEEKLKEKDKIIDLMAKEIYIETDKYENPEEVKRFFKRKVENGELLNCWDYGEEAKKSLKNLLQAYKQDEKVIEEMALYIRSIKTDYNQEYCNLENCNYHKTNCSSKSIIDYFRKKCE